MFAAPRLTNVLPENAEIRLRLRWFRGPVGVPVLAPRVVIGNRHKRA